MDNTVVWNIKKSDAGAVETISAALGVSTLTAHLLVNRAITTVTDADIFLNPCLEDLHDPFLLPDMEKAVARLSQAIDAGETIFLHGDYDTDGVTSTALGFRALTALGAKVIPHIPRRSEGYDLQIVGVEKAKAQGASLILTCDCGTRALPAILRAKELGLEVIITDHHRPGPELPPALAIVNPYRDGFEVPFQALCGAGVIFKVMDALVYTRRPALRRSFRERYLDLVALGTVADMTPLVDENRILVSHGLRSLTDTTKKGLRSLIASLKLRGKLLTSENIGWSLGPCLNAAGRIEEAEVAFRLLVTGDEAEAEQLTADLATIREQSRAEAARVTLEALQEALSDEYSDHKVLVLARDRWGKGVVGLAATRVLEATRRPVMILSYNAEHDLYVGSARSLGKFALHTALAACHDLLSRYGGHSMAAGLSVPAKNLAAFRERMQLLAADMVPDEPEPPVIEIDAEVTNGRLLTLSLLQEFGLLEPFGEENPEPVFVSYRAEIMEVRRVGKDADTLSLQLLLPGASTRTKAVWFRNGERAGGLRVGDEIDLVYTPKINDYRDKLSVELYLKDFRPAQPSIK